MRREPIQKASLPDTLRHLRHPISSLVEYTVGLRTVSWGIFEVFKNSQVSRRTELPIFIDAACGLSTRQPGVE